MGIDEVIADRAVFDRVLVELAKDGIGACDVFDAFRSRPAQGGRQVYAQGSRWVGVRRATFEALKRHGLSYSRIAGVCGVNKRTVEHALTAKPTRDDSLELYEVASQEGVRVREAFTRTRTGQLTLRADLVDGRRKVYLNLAAKGWKVARIARATGAAYSSVLETVKLAAAKEAV